MPARSAQPVSAAGRAAQRRKRWWRNACRETQGDAGKALLRDRGNESLRRRLSEGAPSRGAHAGDGFIVGGSYSRAKTWLANELSVVKSGGKEVSHLEKNSDLGERCDGFVIYINVNIDSALHTSPPNNSFSGGRFFCVANPVSLPWVGMETPVSAPRSGAAPKFCLCSREMGPFGSTLCERAIRDCRGTGT